MRGDRFNKGKTRHALAPDYAQEQYAKVLTTGAEKYSPNNWRKGMPWLEVMDSLLRHANAWKSGEDYDPETGLLHTAHIMCNAAFLTEYYMIAPQYDDRPHSYLQPSKIGLDVDEVLADWVGHWTERFGQERPEVWSFDRNIKEKFDQVDQSFWMSIPMKTYPHELSFEPACYITSRPIPTSITEQWLDECGFPAAPVYTVKEGESKAQVALQAGIDIFVDDRYENFVQMNRAGICCYLFDAPHNQRYDVGHKRIKNLSELC